MSDYNKSLIDERNKRKWWVSAANKWFADPNADSELLYVASHALTMTDQTLSRQCLEECRIRRRRRKK